MKIYIVRHGETDYNHQGLIQGRIDNPLNAAGIHQARAIVGTFFQDKQIDYAISSSLLRAQKTLELIMDTNQIKLKSHIDDGFIERDFGELEGQHIQKFYNCLNFQNIRNYEQDALLEARLLKAINKVVHLPAKNILIVSHSHAMKALLISLFADQFDFSYRLKNCAIIELTYKNNQFSFAGIY